MQLHAAHTGAYVDCFGCPGFDAIRVDVGKCAVRYVRQASGVLPPHTETDGAVAFSRNSIFGIRFSERLRKNLKQLELSYS